MRLYDHPRYYDIAFAWRDIEREVEVMELLSKRLGCGAPGSVLEVACGHAPHAGAWSRRHWRFAGLDRSEQMLAEARRRALDAGVDAELICADLCRFDPPAGGPVDLAAVLLGSLYVHTVTQLHKHLDCMSHALAPGGLYILDWCVHTADDHEQTWETSQDGISVQFAYSARAIQVSGERILREILEAHVNDNGRKLVLHEECARLAITLEELRTILAARSDFVLAGCWNNWNLEEPVVDAARAVRPIVALRRVHAP